MKRNQACHPYALAALLLISVITHLSCRKSEPPTPAPVAEEKKGFFEAPKGRDMLITSIVNALNRLNEKSPFAEIMVHNAGQPQWAFAKVKSNSSARETAGEQIINIPFVKEGAFKTSAILSVDIVGADTSYNLFYPQHYLRYALDDDATNANQQTAKEFFSVFAGFDHDLFGITEYRVNDGRIFGYNKEDKVEVTFSYPDETNARQGPASAPNMAAADYIQICRTIKACVVATARCVSSVQCTYVWQEEGGTQPPPTTPSGGGSSGTPGAGGGSGTGGMLVPPCVRTMNVNGRELIASDPCGEPWDAANSPTPCPKSFKFKKVIDVDNTTNVGGWQVAGVNNVHLNIIDLTTREMQVLKLPTLYFGLPVIRQDGEFYSTSTASNNTAEAVDKAEKDVMEKYHTLGGKLDVVGMNSYFRQRINYRMSQYGGSASLEPGLNINVTPTDAIYPGILGLECL